MLLAACMSVYTPCACLGDGNFSQSGYCPDVDFALIVAKVLDVCQCTMLAQTCWCVYVFASASVQPEVYRSASMFAPFL